MTNYADQFPVFTVNTGTKQNTLLSGNYIAALHSYFNNPCQCNRIM